MRVHTSEPVTAYLLSYTKSSQWIQLTNFGDATFGSRVVKRSDSHSRLQNES